MKLNRIKILAVTVAADDAGYTEVPYPIMHALFYFLSHGPLQLSFPGYVFSTSIHPRFGVFNDEDEDITYPESLELSEELDRLTAEGFLQQISGSVKFSLGEEARELKENILAAFAQLEGEPSFDQLVNETTRALGDYRSLISQCYELYLRL